MKCACETGSTDCICYATVGSNDPVTSALHIVVGECAQLLLMSMCMTCMTCSLQNRIKLHTMHVLPYLI